MDSIASAQSSSLALSMSEGGLPRFKAISAQASGEALLDLASRAVDVLEAVHPQRSEELVASATIFVARGALSLNRRAPRPEDRPFSGSGHRDCRSLRLPRSPMPELDVRPPFPTDLRTVDPSFATHCRTPHRLASKPASPNSILR